MMQPISGTAPVNRVSRDALDALRSTRLALTERILCRLPAGTRNAAAPRVHGFVQSLQTDLNTRLREVREWDLEHGIPAAAKTADDLTLANATSWAVFEPELTLLPQDPQRFAGKRKVAAETLSDIGADDPRWEALRAQIHADVFFISINWGSAKTGEPVSPRSYRFGTDFLNFHEHAPHRNDKNALLTKFSRFLHHFTDADGVVEEFSAPQLSGGYLTDLYKGIPTPTQDVLETVLGSEHRSVVLEVMLELLHEELSILAGPVRPVLACLGRAAEGPVRQHFEPLGYEVLYIPHYSGAANHVPLAERREAFSRLDAAVSRAKAEQRVAATVS